VTRQAVSGSIRIAYELRGAGEPLLLVHGLGYARWGWEPVLDGLAGRFLVVAFDNRGIGESDAPPGPYTARFMAEDGIAVLDAAGIERAHVVGTSLGGMVAQELALGFPERVARLVLVCTTPGGPAAYPMPQRTRRLLAETPALPPAERLCRLVENALSEKAARARPELVERILAGRLAVPYDPAAWQAQAAAGAAFDALERIGEIQAPTLVLHGTDDAVVDPRNGELLAARIADARLERFQGAGHLLFWEQPERFVRLVVDFLAEEGT